MDIHGGIDVLHDGVDVVACYFITGENGAFLPVCPIQGPVAQRQGKRMGQDLLPCHHFPVIPPIVITAGYVLLFGVSPVDFVVSVVDGQTIGPVDVLIDDYGSGLATSVHSCPFDLWHLSPVCPEHPSV